MKSTNKTPWLAQKAAQAQSFWVDQNLLDEAPERLATVGFKSTRQHCQGKSMTVTHALLMTIEVAPPTWAVSKKRLRLVLQGILQWEWDVVFDIPNVAIPPRRNLDSDSLAVATCNRKPANRQ